MRVGPDGGRTNVTVPTDPPAPAPESRFSVSPGTMPGTVTISRGGTSMMVSAQATEAQREQLFQDSQRMMDLFEQLKTTQSQSPSPAPVEAKKPSSVWDKVTHVLGGALFGVFRMQQEPLSADELEKFKNIR